MAYHTVYKEELAFVRAVALGLLVNKDLYLQAINLVITHLLTAIDWKHDWISWRYVLVRLASWPIGGSSFRLAD